MATEETINNHPMTKEEMLRFRKVAGTLSLTAVVFMGGLLLLVHYEAIKLYPSSVNVNQLNTYGERAQFAFRYQSLLAFWLLFNIIATIYSRYVHLAINPLESKTEEPIQKYKNILTNSYETLVLSVLSQLVFLSFASPVAILKIIPLVNIVNFIGRITFFVGYPWYRSFGFLSTIIPSVVLAFYNIYMFGSFLCGY